jgi:electron transport complex protein RnfE
MKGFGKAFLAGFVAENPLLILMIGLCSALAVTTTTQNGLCMGLAMTFVLVCSEIVIGIFKKLIPDSVRIPIFIVVIAAFTTIIQYILEAYLPALAKALGVFIPLIVVNCIIMGRVEAFSYKQPVGLCVADGLGMGLGYTWVLVGISVVREILGAGAIWGIPIPGINDRPCMFFALPPGGFFVFALFISLGLFLKSLGNKKVNRNKVGCC